MIPRLLLAAALLGLVAGCKTTETTTDTKAPAAKAERAQYVQQNSLGSWVPRRVKKSDTNAEVDDATERRTLEQMRQDQLIRNMPKETRPRPTGG